MKSTLIPVIALTALVACSSPQETSSVSSQGNSSVQTASGAAKPPPVKHQVWEVDVGVICDRVQRRCFTKKGPSVAHTDKYMGDAAADRLIDEIRAAGDSWNPTRFMFSDGVVCYTVDEICFLNEFDDEPARAQTKSLFAEYKRRRLNPRIAPQPPQ